MNLCRRYTLGCFAALLLCGCFTACGESFEPYWKLDRYRVLGIKSDPLTLRPGEAAEVSVLDHVPAGEAVSYQWSWCPVTPSAEEKYECPLADPEEQSGDNERGEGPEMPFDAEMLELGEGASAELPYPGTADQVLEICRQIQRAIAEASEQSNLAGSLPTSNCQRGYDISVRLRAESDAGTVEVAKKNLTLWTGAEEADQNPEHGGLEIRVARSGDVPKVREQLDWVPAAETERSEQWVEVPTDEPWPIVGGVTFQVRAMVDGESAEEYRPPPPAGSDREQMPVERESLTFRWFGARVNLEDDQRIFIPDTNELDEIRRTGVTVGLERGEQCAGADEGDGECRAALYSVVRDGRLGLDFARAEFRVVGGVQ